MLQSLLCYFGLTPSPEILDREERLQDLRQQREHFQHAIDSMSTPEGYRSAQAELAPDLEEIDAELAQIVAFCEEPH